jgi:hypothetical protein
MKRRACARWQVRTIALALPVILTFPTHAGEPWLAAGDVQLRHDVNRLVDEGVLNLPVSAWPIATSDLAHAIDEAVVSDRDQAKSRSKDSPGSRSSPTLSAGQRAALARLRKLAVEGEANLGAELSGGRPQDLRGFEDTPREDAELTVYGAGFLGTRFGGRLEMTGALQAQDDRAFRLDGSYVAGKFGNWVVTVGQQERWWGSGWEGSLILSTNARPVPTIAFDRAVSLPFETKWLSWIGPWRLTTFMGRMEGDRQDYAHPLLWGLRLTARPLQGLELSIERTAQWCGEGRSCTLSDFWNLFSGKDNTGENISASEEPGNQLASWDVRWASPIGAADYTVYWQHTGESIDHHIPRPYRTLDLMGVETWGDWGSLGSSWRAGFEWANTRCGGTQNGKKLWDCAYNHHIFDPDGYRYYGRAVGHTIDGDGDSYSVRFIHLDPAANTLSLVARYSKINEGGQVPDTRHSVAAGPENWIGLDASYRRHFGNDWFELGFGGDHRDRMWKDEQVLVGRAWLQWNHAFR